MLYLLCGEWVTGFRPKPFHPGVRDTIGKDKRRFDEFCTAISSRRGPIPCPAVLGVGAEETGECEKAVAPEDTTLYSEPRSERRTILT